MLEIYIGQVMDDAGFKATNYPYDTTNKPGKSLTLLHHQKIFLNQKEDAGDPFTQDLKQKIWNTTGVVIYRNNLC